MPLRGAQIWRLQTKLYKFGWHTSVNSAWMKNSRDLILGEVVYIAIIYHIPDFEFIYWMVTIFSFDHMTGVVLFVVLFCCFLCSRHGCLSAPAIFWWWGGSHSHLRLETEPSIAAISLTKLLLSINLVRLLWAQISRYSVMPSGIVWQFKAYWFTVRLRGKTVRPWVGIPNRESHGQTVRVGRSATVLQTAV